MPTPPSTPPAAIVAAETSLHQLQRLVEGLLFVSESEAPVQIFQLPPTPDLVAALRAAVGRPAAEVREQPLEEILGERAAPPDGAGQLDVRQAPAYAALLRWLRTHVREARAVRLGAQAPQELFLLGRTPDGGWLGVRTTTVDT